MTPTPSGNPLTTRKARRIVLPLLLTASLPALAADVPYNAGLHRLSVPYFETAIDVAVWVPTHAEEAVIEAGPFSPMAAGGAAIAPGRHPLLLLSHGTGGMNLNHHTLAAAMARAGYIVAAPTHPGDNYRDRHLIADPRYWLERPRQLSVVLDALLASARYGERIDRTRIGAIGHSAGGYSVAALAGLQPDPARLRAHCSDGAGDPACAYADPAFGVADPAPEPFALPAGHMPPMPVGDPRIHAVAMLAPVGAVFAENTAARPGVRLRLIAAGRDEVLTAADHAERLRSLEPKVEASVAEDAGHFAFMAPVAARWRPVLGMIAEDPPGFDRAAFQRPLATALVDWFDDALAAPGR